MVYKLIALFLPLLSQFTVTANGIYTSTGDVNAVMTPLTNRIGSFFNVIKDFSGVIIALLVFFILLRLLKINK